MTENKNLFLFKRNLVNLEDAGQDNLLETTALQRQLMTYGYMLSQEAFDHIKSASLADVVEYFKDCETWIKAFKGTSLKYTSLFPSFPKGVMSMSDSQFYYKQFQHYWTGKTFEQIVSVKTDKAFSHKAYTIIEPCSENDFLSIFTNLLSVNGSLTGDDTKLIKWFVTSGQKLIFPDTIPFKENLAVIAEICPSFTVKTVTDVLRIACSMSLIEGGATLLPVPKNKFKRTRANWKFNLTASEKKRILELFENSNLDVREMNQGRKYQRFVRLFEIIKPERNYKDFPKTASAAQRLRNQRRFGNPTGTPVIRTWYYELEKALALGLNEGVSKLQERAGEFGRRLDYLIRKNPTQSNLIIRKFGETNASNKVLYEMLNHFSVRDKPTNRSISIKGGRQSIKLPTLPALPKTTVSNIKETILEVLKDRFSKLEPLGKVWIDPELKKIPLPTNMRSISESLKPTVRGQRIKLDSTTKAIRPFIHWNDKQGREDIDLHGYLIGSKTTQFGFNGERKATYGCYSGDVRHRVGPCAEYIMLDLKEALANGFKYFITVAHNYDNTTFKNKQDCYVGFTEETSPSFNENRSWTPDNVFNTFKLDSESQYCLFGAIDLETREYIHIDIDWSLVSTVGNHSGQKLMDEIQKYVNPPEFSVYDLIEMHVVSRGEKTSPEEAETTFLYNDFIHSYDKTLLLMGV